MPRSWMVGPSRIHGFGVFATAPIVKGEALGAMDCARFDREALKNGEPGTGVVTGGVQLAVMGGFPLWYLNYGDDPNVGVVCAYPGDTMPLVGALRDIRLGEELTLANAMNAPLPATLFTVTGFGIDGDTATIEASGPEHAKAILADHLQGIGIDFNDHTDTWRVESTGRPLLVVDWKD